jgi:hypothetical protein
MIRIRGGSGLGDAIYQRPIVDKLISHGHKVEVCCDYPEVFIGSPAIVSPFRRQEIDIIAHYTNGKSNPYTNQWQDVCARAGVACDLHMRWHIQNVALVERVRHQAAGRPLVLVHGGRVPMDRTDGFGAELLPTVGGFNCAIDAIRGECFLVRIGGGEQVYPLETDLDLIGKTSVSDLIDLGSCCDGIVAQCSFAVPMAEVFDKPLLAVWAANGMHHQREPYIQQITPRKVLSKATSLHVVDDWDEEKIIEVAHAFRHV